jgi:curved DNA-binding protein CbpA
MGDNGRPDSPTADPYSRLGVSPTATPADIKRAYRKAVKNFHPDVNPSARARSEFLSIKEAFEVLSSAHRRSQLDAQLFGAQPPATPRVVKFEDDPALPGRVLRFRRHMTGNLSERLSTKLIAAPLQKPFEVVPVWQPS